MSDWVDRLERGVRRVRRGVEAVREGARPPSDPPNERLSAVRPVQPLSVTSEPPVVARMIVEIRSDGTRTLARGALEDVQTGERTTLEASGGSPTQLAASLASSLMKTPLMLSKTVGALVRARLRGGGKP